MVKIRMLVIFLFVVAVAHGQAPKKAVALETVPCYEEPRSDLLPRIYLGPKDTVLVDSVFIDSGSVAWFRVRSKALVVWTPGAPLRYVAAMSEKTSVARIQDDTDKYRRLNILRSHADWPRRIINAVRAGQICLGMTGVQLAAAWDEPEQKEKLFILGIGACACWRFAATDKKICSVILQDDAIIGWSQEQ